MAQKPKRLRRLLASPTTLDLARAMHLSRFQSEELLNGLVSLGASGDDSDD